MTRPILRGAISGFGQVAQYGHLPGWQSLPDVSIVAVHEPLPARRHEALRQIKGVRAYEDLGLMLDAERLDFLDIASPPALHAGAAQMALEAGVHVLVEKPASLESGQLDRMAATAARNRLTLRCVHNWKYAPSYRMAHALIKSGRLGKLKYIALNRLRSGQAGDSSWRLDPEVGGGGIIIDHGWHIFYLMQWLAGNNAPITVSARLGCPPGSFAEDVADLQLEFPERIFGYAHLSWRASLRRTSALIYGDTGALEIEGDKIILTERSGCTEEIIANDAPDDSYHSVWFIGLTHDFETAVRTGAGADETATNLFEARTALASIQAIKDSAKRNGQAVLITVARDP